MKINALTMTDFYKTGHIYQYPKGTTLVYSNFTPRSSRLAKHIGKDYDDKVVFFGLQGFIKWFLQDCFNESFFNLPKEQVINVYKRRMDTSLGPDSISMDHIAALHDLGYLPVEIKALPEGSRVDIRVPMFTIKNTHPDFFWVTNFLESVISAEIWKSCVTATTAYEYKKLLNAAAKKTGAPLEFVPFQGHDFSFRGMSGCHDASASSAGHLLSFVGTDTIPAIDYLENYYNADPTKELIGCSVPATEHSVASMNILNNIDSVSEVQEYFDEELNTWVYDSKLNTNTRTRKLTTPDEKMEYMEFKLIKRLITEVYPSGIVSLVSDTFDFWRAISVIAPKLKKEILNRIPDALGLAKTVFRPDSGDPVEIICGTEYEDLSDVPEDKIVDKLKSIVKKIIDVNDYDDDTLPEETIMFKHNNNFYEAVCLVSLIREEWLRINTIDVEYKQIERTPAQKGAVECLWDIFGGTLTDKGYKVLHERVGLIYGDSITLERCQEIMRRLEKKGFASNNCVFGIGSYTYQFCTRDTFGFAVKSTYGEVNHEPRVIFKDPKTDSGVKKSAVGLLRVEKENGKFVLYDNQPTDEGGLLETVFKDGVLLKEQSLSDIRKVLND